VDVAASFPADAQAAEAVQPGDGPLDDPPEGPQAGAVRLVSFGDHRPVAPLAKEPAGAGGPSFRRTRWWVAGVGGRILGDRCDAVEAEAAVTHRVADMGVGRDGADGLQRLDDAYRASVRGRRKYKARETNGAGGHPDRWPPARCHKLR
jgi:hypothetical protein